jgi:hypothetical protein
VFECRNGIISALIIQLPGIRIYGDGERWPDIQRRPRGCSVSAYNPQVQTMRRCKDDMSPSSTYVHQPFPPPPPPPRPIGLLSTEMKNLQEGIVREFVNSRLVYTRLATACHGHCVQDSPRLDTSMDSEPSVERSPVTEPSERPSSEIDDPGVRGDKYWASPIDSGAIGLP